MSSTGDGIHKNVFEIDERLDKSIRLLNYGSKNKFFRSKPAPQTLADINFSTTVNSAEAHILFDNSNYQNETQDGSVMSLAHSTSVQIRSITEKRTDQLYEQFLEILKTRNNDAEIFDTVSELTQVVADTLTDVQNQAKGGKKPIEIDWLVQEKNTWQLLFALYKDRIMVQKEDLDLDIIPFGNSEKIIVERLYCSNAKLREYQLIVDWLEETALENLTDAAHYADRTIGWENTLHELQNVGATVFGKKNELVSNLDPDAPFREKKPLHDLDTEDEQRLTRQIFYKLRHGRLQEAQTICEQYGQSWRAAIFEGWRLHHDPNYEPTDLSGLKRPIEGNPRRDLWKRCAWQMAENKEIDPYTRASAGLYCGHLESLLNVITNTWADALWAYLKVQIDIRVESEIHNFSSRSYLKMPEKYWTSKMSLEQIFEELKSHKNLTISTTAKNPVTVIQQYLILDDIPELMRHVNSWLEMSTISLQMLRFLTHIVLFIRHIGRSHQEEVSDKVIRAYVESLIKLGNSQMVAYYTAALPSHLQINLYSQFLETITVSADRPVAFNEGVSHGLDLLKITFITVDRVRNYESDLEETKFRNGTISSLDQTRISMLEWLTFQPEQICDLLWQANALVRIFLAQSKIECIRETFSIVPKDAIQTLIRFYGSSDNLPYREECCVKEYYCHETYLAAIDGYYSWSDCFYKQRPKRQPSIIVKPTGFTEKVALEHQEHTFKENVEKWKKLFEMLTARTRDLFNNILLFPDNGWLKEELPDHLVNQPEWINRANQLDNLRKIIIPEIELLLHKILTLSEKHQECVRLANNLANEEYGLYNVYSKQQMKEFLNMLADSSLTLLNEKKDPFFSMK